VRSKGSDIEITPEDLEGKVVGVQRATTNDRYLTDNYADTVTIRRYGSYEELFLDMAAGRLDLMLGSVVPIKLGFLDTEQGQGFEFVGPAFSDPRWFGEGTGIAVRKADDELRAMFNEAIRAIRANGVYDEIASRYFDVTPNLGEQVGDHRRAIASRIWPLIASSLAVVPLSA
jgi:arginine/ornithine transport system substrate-binding protein